MISNFDYFEIDVENRERLVCLDSCSLFKDHVADKKKVGIKNLCSCLNFPYNSFLHHNPIYDVLIVIQLINKLSELNNKPFFDILYDYISSILDKRIRFVFDFDKRRRNKFVWKELNMRHIKNSSIVPDAPEFKFFARTLLLRIHQTMKKNEVAIELDKANVDNTLIFVLRDSIPLDLNINPPRRKRRRRVVSRKRKRTTTIKPNEFEPPNKKKKGLKEWLKSFKMFLENEHFDEKHLVSLLKELSFFFEEAFSSFETILTINNIPISVRDIYTLIPHNLSQKSNNNLHFWISDNVIEAYGYRLFHSFSEHVHLFSTSFYVYFIEYSFDYDKLRIFHGHNLFLYQVLVVPIHLENHWVGYFLNRVDWKEDKDKRLTIRYQGWYRDSFGSPEENFEKCKKVSKKMSLFFSRYIDDNDDHGGFNVKEFTIENLLVQTNKQQNIRDCGVFLCSYFKNVIGDTHQFEQAEVDSFRLEIIKKLLSK